MLNSGAKNIESMQAASPITSSEEVPEEFAQQPTSQEVLAQLDRLINSSHFRNSKRYPALLRYIVEEVLAGRAESLKERTLGMCVFERSADYDTNSDPVVRITAGEVRKRIAQYYQTPGHEHELRVEIPLGSYIPRFFSPVQGSSHPDEETPQSFEAIAAEDEIVPTVFEAGPSQQATEPDACCPTTAETVAPKSSWKRLHLPAVYALFFITLAALGVSVWSSSLKASLAPESALFWEQMLRSSSPTLIVLGVHSFDAQGNDISAVSHASMPQPQQTLLSAMTRSDMVHLSDVMGYGAFTEFLTAHNHTFRTQGASDTTLEQLKQSPFMLLGGFNNIWSIRLSQELRFQFITLKGPNNVIQDRQHPETIWSIDPSASALSNSQDYGLVSCFLDPKTDQYVILVGGIGKSGTEAATDFLTNEKNLAAWLRTVPKPSGSNVEVVVRTDVIEGEHGPPQVIAYQFW